MPLIDIETFVEADICSCFDLARNIDFHQASLEHSNEKAIAGKTTGLIELGEWVTWEAKHFGITQQLTSKITEFDRPNYFTDEMVSGTFKSFKHEHRFISKGSGTLIRDKFYFHSPYGIFGKLANILFLKRYMKHLLETRNAFLKEKAEELSHIS